MCLCQQHAEEDEKPSPKQQLESAIVERDSLISVAELFNRNCSERYKKSKNSSTVSPSCNARTLWKHCTAADFNISRVLGAKRPQRGFLTLLMPLRPRDTHDYLMKAVDSIVDNSSPSDRRVVTAIVFLGNDLDEHARRRILRFMTQRYERYLASGFLQVAQSPLEQELLQRPQRLETASASSFQNSSFFQFRQLVDFGFALKYCLTQGNEYFMLLSDDVIMTENYIPAIEGFHNINRNRKWVSLQFATPGMTGKFISKAVLRELTDFSLFFTPYHSVDILYQYYIDLRLQRLNYIRKPSIFDRICNRTTRPNVTQELHYSKTPHNPPVKFHTSLEAVDGKHLPAAAYGTGLDFFHGKFPKADDFFVLVFREPTTISRVIVNTGVRKNKQLDPKESIRDILLDGSLELSHTRAEDGKSECVGYQTLGYFVLGSVDVQAIEDRFSRDAHCLRIKVLQTQIQWLVISSISIWTQQQKEPSSA
ncbi:alpha-1,3-mannosyl-glycoprotein 4-beta-N-acetylglucosaminyltransferase C-like [Diadema antillarum]|uniref:alpha-1,3-mannosyl-glycoprotein 4-beta-N-acetylglucosaminyltransferase C-like n=1 Tax=Diadema antillarum TaxID=105358 RepID=UPI003A892E6B